jgi:cation-transporting ATPase E
MFDAAMSTLNSKAAPIGLTKAGALARHASGLGNATSSPSSRTLASILGANFLGPFNLIIYTLGIILIALGFTTDGIFSVSMILLTGTVGAYQEIMAKRKLERLSLLTRPHVSVLRDGGLRSFAPEEVVQGDTIKVNPGDQIVADGCLISGSTEMDEALLTGESRPISKSTGDLLRSGSFCVLGGGWMIAEAVGRASYVNRMSAAAKSFRIVVTPLQQDIRKVIELMISISITLAMLTLFAAFAQAVRIHEVALAMAVIAGVVPIGLIQSVMVAYLLGAVRIAGKGVLVQQANAVESMSAVTVLCMDKTGTLTANRPHLTHTFPLGVGFESIIGDFAASVATKNRTVEAISKSFSGVALTPVSEVVFSSSHKWSGLGFDTNSRCGVYVLGAPEALSPFLAVPDPALAKIKEWECQGVRVLLFASHPDPNCLSNLGDPPHPPEGLTLLAVLGFTDELRPKVQETLAEFLAAGVQPKIISGDSPETVAAIARMVGLPDNLRMVSGLELAQMDDAQLEQAAANATIFGRVNPEQKERLVAALKQQGGYVAMIGDGVNDILALKKANLGIALESGSAATRSVADLILMGDSFGGLPFAVREGRRVVNGMQSILSLYLTRGLLTVLLIIATGYIGIGFPFVPRQVSLLSVLTVGIPAFGLIYWASATVPNRPMSLMFPRFVFPAALTVALFGLLTYMLFFYLKMRMVVGLEVSPEILKESQAWAGIGHQVGADGIGWRLATATARAGLTHFTVIAGLFLIVFIQPPLPNFGYRAPGDKGIGNVYPSLMACGIGVAYGLALTFAPLRQLLQFPPYPPLATILLFITAAAWIVTLQLALQSRLMERLWTMPTA